MNDLTFDRDDIVTLLTDLGSALDQRGIRADMFVVGGAAIALAYNTRRMTRDIDGVFEPKAEIYSVASDIAKQRGLPEDWLNDAVKGLLPGQDPHAKEVLNVPGLRVSVPSTEYLLALKIQAARIDRDTDDIVLLAREAGATSAEDVLHIAEKIIGKNRLLPKAQFLIQEIFDQSSEEPHN